MAIEWVVLGKKVAPAIAKEAGEMLKSPLLKTLGLDASSKALTEANQQFVLLFEKEFEYREVLPTLVGPSVADSLAAFCQNGAVQQVLAEPFGDDEEVNWQQLRAIWPEMSKSDGSHLVELPDDFDWRNLGKKYVKAVQEIITKSPELRQTRDSRSLQQTTEQLRHLVGPKPGLDIEGYRKYLDQAYGILKLGSLDPDWSKYVLRLQKVYVPQTAKEALPQREVTRDYLKKLEQEERLHRITEEELKVVEEEYIRAPARPVMEVVDDSRCRLLVILGDPGLGKSTLLQLLALRWAERQTGPVPFLIELRRYVGDANAPKSFLEFFESGTWSGWRFSQLDLHRLIRQEDSILMFDGLDEIFEPMRRASVVNEIIRFSGEYPKARIIVTTRIVGYHPGSKHPETFRNANFRQFTLQDFSPGEIEEFRKCWYNAAFPKNPEERDRYGARLSKAITESDAVRELAGNPLLLTMMAILSRKQDLPRERCRLYEECADLLLQDWETDKFPDARDRITLRQKQRMLQRVAYEMQSERTGLAGNLLSEERLEEVLAEHLRELGIQEPWSVAQDLVKKLHERNFMLSSLGDGQYAFVHRTFLEYFCAREYAYRFQSTKDLTAEGLRELFAVHWENDEWREVLRLICALIGAEYSREVVESLLEQKGQNNERPPVLFAAECLGEIQEIGLVVDLRSRVKAGLVQVFEGATEANFSAISRAGELLAKGWRDDPEVLRLVKERAIRAPHALRRVIALNVLSSNWRDDPEVLHLVKGRATRDPDTTARVMALNVLASRWRDDPEVLRLVKERVAQDPDTVTRVMALEVLGSNWRDDPEVRHLAKERATQDPNSFGRGEVLVVLASHWGDDPDVRQLVMDRATQDLDPYERRKALEVLASNWNDDPEVRQLAKELATEDQKSGSGG